MHLFLSPTWIQKGAFFLTPLIQISVLRPLSMQKRTSVAQNKTWLWLHKSWSTTACVITNLSVCKCHKAFSVLAATNKHKLPLQKLFPLVILTLGVCFAFVLAIKWREVEDFIFCNWRHQGPSLHLATLFSSGQVLEAVALKGKDEGDIRTAILLPEFASEWH